METEKVNIWLDCDVGNDDAMAIILAAYHPKSNLLGISTCFGNTCLENCTNNTLKVLSSMGCDHIPVYKGAEFSLKSIRATTKMHGSQGTDQYFSGLFAVDRLVKHNDVVKDIDLYHLIKKQVGDDKFTIVITGPQTNIVMLLQQHPELISQLNEIVFMGGTSGFGNVTPNAEYNIYSDPEAAQMMIDICNKQKIKLVMIALDLTYTCLVVEAQQRKMNEINTNFSDWCLQVIQEFQEAYKAQDFDYPPLHDPLAVFYALHPELFITKPTYVVVECESALCYGRTVIDKHNRYGKDPTLEFAQKLDVDQFWIHMIDAIKQASRYSKIEQLGHI